MIGLQTAKNRDKYICICATFNQFEIALSGINKQQRRIYSIEFSDEEKGDYGGEIIIIYLVKIMLKIEITGGDNTITMYLL